MLGIPWRVHSVQGESQATVTYIFWYLLSVMIVLSLSLVNIITKTHFNGVQFGKNNSI